MDMEITPEEALQRAIARMRELPVQGYGAAALARSFSPPITPHAVRKWRQAPPHRVLDIEKITGVSKHLLRPDLYPIEKREAAE